MMKTTLPKAALFLKENKRTRYANSKEERLSFMTQRSLTESLDAEDGEVNDLAKLKEEECLQNLQEGCRLANIPISDSIVFRFACFYNFNYELARTAIVEKFDDPHLHLRMDGELMQQFENMVIFPLPGLMTKNNKHEVLYFHACRHFPSEMDIELLIQNVLYVFNDMSLTQEQCRNGVAFLIDLNHWAFKNFTPDCANKFLKAVQHQVPTKVATVLVVNGPLWFPKCYRCVFKKMLTKSSAKKVRILKDPKHLEDYLMNGYEKYLPLEMSCGWQDSNEIVEDYIDKKVHDESITENIAIGEA